MKHLRVVAVCGLALAGLDAGAGVSPESSADGAHWDDRFTPAGVDGYVYDVADDDDENVYIAGLFRAVGNVPAKGVAKWTAATGTWSTLEGYPREEAHNIAVDASGNIYACNELWKYEEGPFEWGNKASQSSLITTWTAATATWSALGETPQASGSQVNVLTLDACGDLLIAGGFESVNGVAANHVARWDGKTWSALGAGIGGENSQVLDMAADGHGNVYVVGEDRGYSSPDRDPGSWAMKWTAEAGVWTMLGDVVKGHLGCLALDRSGNLYVGGWLKADDKGTAAYVAKWEGAGWSTLEPPEADRVSDLAMDGSGILCAAIIRDIRNDTRTGCIVQWDGKAWSRLGSGACRVVYRLGIEPSGNLYGLGWFKTTSGVITRGIARWNGAAWSALVPQGMGIDYGVTALARDNAGNVYAGGYFQAAGGVLADAVAKWDGVGWTALGSGLGRGGVDALVTDGSGNVYAGGDFETAGDVAARHVAKWDGEAWSPLGDGLDYDVSDLAVDDLGRLYAGGRVQTGGQGGGARIGKWDGGAWSALVSEHYPLDCLDALTVNPSGTVYAAGYFIDPGGIHVDGVSRWDGTDWVMLTGNGMPKCVRRLIVGRSGILYASWETFDHQQKKASGYVSRWDGNAWHLLGSPMDDRVYDLAVDDFGDLYAGGNFKTAGGVLTSGVAKWDGTTWSALGTGVDLAEHDSVQALLWNQGALFIGGEFAMAGGIVSTNFAIWHP